MDQPPSADVDSRDNVRLDVEDGPSCLTVAVRMVSTVGFRLRSGRRVGQPRRYSAGLDENEKGCKSQGRVRAMMTAGREGPALNI